MDSSLSVDFPPLVSAYMKKVLARLEVAEGKEAQQWHGALARQLVPSQEENKIKIHKMEMVGIIRII